MTATFTQQSVEGHYAKKQLGSKSRLIAWSHGSRFKYAQELVALSPGGTILDYGCGDGTFLLQVREMFCKAIGADIDASQIADCRDRLSAHADLSFVVTPELSVYESAFDTVVCMEVLEHCLPDVRGQVISDLERLVTDDGHVIVSVPIETGPSLAIKQMARMIAGWRGLGDYKYREKYSVLEFCKMLCARESTAISRPVLSCVAGEYHGHKGFNWRVLRNELSRRFHVLGTHFTPVHRLGAVLNSQVWFICRPRKHRECA